MTLNHNATPENPRMQAVSSRISDSSVYRDFPAAIEQWPAVSDFFSAWANEKGCPVSDALLMEMALEELFTNTANYGYPEKEGRVLILLESDSENHAYQVTLADNGLPFNPLSRPVPPLGLSIEEMAIGGLGIHMVREFMDHTEYCHQSGCNVFSFTKYAPSGEKGKPI